MAGIGRVESDHGGYGRSQLDADGWPAPRIVGVPLDGSSGMREIVDTDGGRLDGDTTYDRAVGPMQFLPTTWATYGADGNGDGIRDPHQIDDAARAAAAYLCAEGRDIADGTGWWDGVLTYNRPASTRGWCGRPPTATGRTGPRAALTPVPALAQPGRAGEHRRPGVLDVLHHHVLVGQRALHRHELRAAGRA